MTTWSGNTRALWGEAVLHECYCTETRPTVQFNLIYFIDKVLMIITYGVNDIFTGHDKYLLDMINTYGR